MGWNDLKAAVAAVIKTNGNQEITGALLQSTLNSIIDQVGANASYKGVAIPSTTPGTPDGPVFYITSTQGTYPNFGGFILDGGFAVLSNISGSWVASKIMDIYSKLETDALIKGVELGTLTGLTSYSNQEGNLYLSKQTSLSKYNKAEIDSNHVGGVVHFVQYRELSGTYSLINSTPFVNKVADISSFVFQNGDWVGALVLGSSSGGVKYTGGGTTKYKTGFVTIPSTFSSALTSSLTFALKLSVFSEVDNKIEANNDYFYDKPEVDGLFGSFVSGVGLGGFEGTTYPSTSRKRIYLSKQIQNILEYDKAEIETSHTEGTVHFVQYRESSGTYSLINSTSFVNKVADISSFVFQTGDWIGTWLQSETASGGVKYASPGGVTVYTGEVSSLPSSILSSELTTGNFVFSFKLTLNSVVNQKIEDNNSSYYNKSEVDSKIDLVETNPKFKRVGKIIFTNFRGSNFPAPWTNVGFTPTSNGMQSPVTGGINQIIEYDQYSNLDSFITTFRFNMVSLSNILLTNYHKKLSTSGGHVVGFDLVNDLITVYAATVKGTMPSTVLAQFNIPFTIVTGDSTSIRYERNAMSEKYTIVNGGNSYTAEYNSETQSGTTGEGYDKFGLVFLSGNLIVQEAHYHSQLPSEPDILILGDSIVNGDTIRSLTGGGDKNRWAGIVSQRTLVSISSLGGNTVTDINRDLPFYLSLFKPSKCIYGVGINDSVLSTFTTKADEFISVCEAAGIEPILQTLFPRATREVYCEEVSNWVKSRGVRYIDFRRRMTVDGLGVTRKPNVFLGDNLHPNVLGHSEMAQEVIDTLEL